MRLRYGSIDAVLYDTLYTWKDLIGSMVSCFSILSPYDEGKAEGQGVGESNRWIVSYPQSVDPK